MLFFCNSTSNRSSYYEHTLKRRNGHNTVTGGACIAVISGLGFKGYSVAIDYLILYPSVISSENLGLIYLEG